MKDELFKAVNEIKLYQCDQNCEACELYIDFVNNYGGSRKRCLKNYVDEVF